MIRAGLLGIFAGGRQAARAIAELRRQGFDHMEACGPVPHPDLEAALEAGPSPVRLYTLLGGVLGCASGFALTTGTALQWGLIVGGKPVVALIPFVVIAFELAILFGALATLLGVLIHARLPRRRLPAGHDPCFSSDRFGLLVRCAPDRAVAAEAVLRQAGAEEVRPLHGAAEPATNT
jgi:molybdopterin-containing oxidoreductase family membrane subunit